MFFDTKECEWSDQDVYLNGFKIAKITGLKFKKSQEKEALYAGGDEPISIQKGNKAYEGTLTLLKGAVDNMNTAAITAGGDDLLDITWTLTVVFKAKGARILKSHTLIGIDFDEFEEGLMQNDKKSEIPLAFKYLRKQST